MSDLRAVLQDYGPVLLGAALRFVAAWLGARSAKLEQSDSTSEDEGK